MPNRRSNAYIAVLDGIEKILNKIDRVENEVLSLKDNVAIIKGRLGSVKNDLEHLKRVVGIENTDTTTSGDSIAADMSTTSAEETSNAPGSSHEGSDEGLDEGSDEGLHERSDEGSNDGSDGGATVLADDDGGSTRDDDEIEDAADILVALSIDTEAAQVNSQVSTTTTSTSTYTAPPAPTRTESLVAEGRGIDSIIHYSILDRLYEMTSPPSLIRSDTHVQMIGPGRGHPVAAAGDFQGFPGQSNLPGFANRWRPFKSPNATLGPETPQSLIDYKPRNPELLKFMLDGSQHPKDNLTKRPPRNYSYLNKDDELKDRHPLEADEPFVAPRPIHPDLATARAQYGGASAAQERYYRDLPHNICAPVAGGNGDDNWLISDDRPAPVYDFKIFDLEDTDWTSFQGFFDDAYERIMAKLTDISQETVFSARPQVEVKYPDLIKAYLVDDWENVTKLHMLHQLPAEVSITQILEVYKTDAQVNRDEDQLRLLEEFLAGVRDYFDRCLGKILLYRFERAQYLEVHEGWGKSSSPLYGKSPCDTYGASHLLRLLVSLPELIAQTNMDRQSINKLRDELLKLGTWMTHKNRENLFGEDVMETPAEGYIERNRA